MVLESVIVEILNKFLGEYVESVDSSQLKVAFGGDVALDNLILKQNALDELDLPVKTIFGRLGKLKLTIPWTNLYKAPWIVHIERVFLLAVPLGDVRYDAVREERLAQEAKQRELQKVEEAKRLEAQKGKKVEDATFVENLIAHVIKNLQVTVRDVHLRYEDQRGRPYALGVTLSELRLESTDEAGRPTQAQQTVSLFHKTLVLEGLAFYWNAGTQTYSSLEDGVKLQRFLREIASKEYRPQEYSYMFGPISARAQLQINPKPEVDSFKLPKLKLDMNMDVLSIGITKMQYRDLVKFLESMDQMARAAPYRKYRPNLTKYRGYYAIWWQFAYQCILETEVRRRRNNFSWERIRKHRARCRQYEEAYKKKLESKKPAADVLKLIEDLESKLDPFNIIIMRQRAEVKVQKTRKQEEETKKSAGWFGGWWGGGSAKTAEPTGTAAELATKFEAAMTNDEKAKLYQAIGYQENAAPAQYPPEFVAVCACFSLGKLQVDVQDEETAGRCVVRLVLAGVTCQLQQRPSALATRVEVKMQRLSVTGCLQDGKEPLIARSIGGGSDSSSLLDVLFETNPLDRSCDQRVRVTAQPLELTYDAETVIHLVDVFNPPEKPSLSQLQAMAVSKLEEIREVSATLLQHAIQQQKVLDLDVRLAASRLILPEGGKMLQDSEGKSRVPLMVLSLGSLSMCSRPRDPGLPSIGHLLQAGSTDQQVLQEMIAQSYDRFTLRLSGLQVLVAHANEDWQTGLKEPKNSQMHLVQPTSIDINLNRSLLPNDPRIPQFQVTGQLPSLALSLAEERLLLMAGIVISVPFPQSEPEQPTLQESDSRASSLVTLQQLGKVDRRKTGGDTQALDLVVGSVKLELSFEMKELRVIVLTKEGRLLDFSLLSLELEVTQRSFDLTVALRLGGISMQQAACGKDYRIISTPMSDGRSDYLFTTKLVMVDRKSPEFHVKHKSVEKLLEVCFSSLDLLLHQTAILELMRFSGDLQEKVAAIQARQPPKDRVANTRPALDRLLSTIPEDGAPVVKPAARQRKSAKQIIELLLIAKLENLSVKLANAERELSQFSLRGVHAEVTMMSGQTKVSAKLRTLTVLDLNPDTLYSNIIQTEGDEALVAAISMFDNPSEGQPQMRVCAKMARLHVVFLNRFVSSLLAFLNNFQAAMQAVKDASAAAAEAAKQNVQQAYENATRIALDIIIKAPIVFVPRSVRSTEAFLLDFGVIKMNNKFKDEAAAGGRTMTLDVLSLSLRQMQLTRVMLDDNCKVLSQTFLVRPFDLLVEVERNLSFGWCTQKPGVNLSSNMNPIKFDVNKEDITLGMLVLSENLGDQEPIPEVAEAQMPVAEVSTQPKRPTTLKGVNRQLTDVSQGVEAEESTESPFVQMAFHFEMESIEFNLLLPQSSPTKTPKPDEVHGLAHFTIEKLHVSGKMWSNGMMGVLMKLENCFLKDLRNLRDLETKRISDLMSVKKRRQSQQHMPMIYVEFDSVPPNSKLTASVCGFDLVLCLDYLLKVSDFFVSALPKVDTPPPPPKPKVTSEAMGTVVSRQLSSKPPEGLFEIIVIVERPDIILVETMTDTNTKALIFSMEGDLKVKMTPERQAINMEMKNIQLYSCCFNPSRRQETLCQVLRPCTLSVAGGIKSGEQPSLAVDLSAVRLAVSPVTISILTNCLAAMGGGSVEEESEVKTPPDWSLLWRPKSFSEDNYWFLATDVQDALELVEGPPAPAVGVEGGTIMLSINSLVVTIEAGSGLKTQPLILLESRLEARASNWATALDVQGDISLQMAYYNSRLALWEPLIEPVEVSKHGQFSHVPWNLTFGLKINPPSSTVASPASDFAAVSIQKPKTLMCIASSENLEVTISKSSLDVFDALSRAFQNAVKDSLSARLEENAPYLVQNNTGMRVILQLEGTSFQAEQESTARQIVLETGACIGLVLCETSVLSPVRSGASVLEEQVQEKILPVKIPDKNCVLKLPVARAEKRYYPLGTRGSEGLVSEVRMEGGSRHVTLRSIIQVHNQLNQSVDVYFMTKSGNEVACVGVVQPGQRLDLPLHAVYTPTSEIFFSLPGHTVCITPFIWKELLSNTVSVSKTLECHPRNKEVKEPFFLKAIGDMEQVYFEGTTMFTMASCVFNVTLRPTVVFRNLLPVPLVCASGQGHEETVAPGGHTHVACVNPGGSSTTNQAAASITLRLDNYLEKVWSCKRDVPAVPAELSVWSFDSWDSSVKMTLDLGVHAVLLKDTLYLSLYAPFWMINKTGLMLSYRKSRKTEKTEASGSPLKRWASILSLDSTNNGQANTEDSTNVLYHPPEFVGPVLFSFRPKAFFGKKKACVKVEESDWSNKFSLDVAGSSGSVTCKALHQTYQIGVGIQLASSNLTKLITFTPYHLLLNHAPFAVECQEADRPNDPWVLVPPGDCAPLWPKGVGNRDCTLRLRVQGTKEMTPPFSFSQNHTALLKLHNKFGGISVDVQVSEGAIYVNMSAYEPGLAPALIINHTRSTVEFWEKSTNPIIRKLGPMEEALYTWEDPRGDRKLVWCVVSDSGKREEFSDELRKDGLGRLWVPAGSQSQDAYWVSFLNGMQRVLLFTGSPDVARDAQAAADLEPADTEMTLSLHGMGLSLVGFQEKRVIELLYMGIASSGIIWETRKQGKSKYEALSRPDSLLLEEAHQNGRLQVALSDGVPADLEVGRVGKRELRRSYQPGLWVQLRFSKHQQHLHAKLHTLQVDCQLPDCIFPTVLAPVPLPKSVAADKGPRPYVEISVVKRLLEHSPVQQFRYLRVLVQEFHVKLDMGFLNALLELFTNEESLEADHTEKVATDCQIVVQPLRAHVAVHAAQEQKNFYDELHLSPLKIHVSFSMSTGLTGKVGANSRLSVLHALLQNVGVTLTDLQDVIFKLGYFEREGAFLTQRQLNQEVTVHYTQQAVKQLYVLVLGLDVIGNPFGLVLGLKQGVEDLFYEPFQGAIQGPGEFAEGLRNGVRSLLGHTLSGTAAAMSRITGTVGKTLANLSFDEEYQRRRREQQMNRPAALHEGLVQSGKGLVTGVVSGVTGVITKPISGAQNEGVGGFFKGIGAGVLGLVTQPTGGVIDFASNTLDSVKRAADTADETKALRFPRYIPLDGLIKPYSPHEATGNRLLNLLEKGKFTKTDCYVYHVAVGSKEVVLLTNKRILLASRNDLFGQWTAEWNYPWAEMRRPPELAKGGVLLHTGETQKKVMGLFKSGDATKLIVVQDDMQAQKIIELSKTMLEERVPKTPPR